VYTYAYIYIFYKYMYVLKVCYNDRCFRVVPRNQSRTNPSLGKELLGLQKNQSGNCIAVKRFITFLKKNNLYVKREPKIWNTYVTLYITYILHVCNYKCGLFAISNDAIVHTYICTYT
jgi:hypothetical protein